MLWKISWWTVAILAIVFVAFMVYRGLQIQGNYR
jgi:hypothetical protein